MTEVATAMMKNWMERAQMPSVQELVQMCLDMGVKLYACTTTMGVMGVSEADLVEGVSCLGAAGFLDFAAEADVNLFI